MDGQTQDDSIYRASIASCGKTELERQLLQEAGLGLDFGLGLSWKDNITNTKVLRRVNDNRS